jgi:hypothetical protein
MKYVKCIHPDSIGQLELNKVYKVTRTKPYHYYLENPGKTTGGWYKTRFVDILNIGGNDGNSKKRK